MVIPEQSATATASARLIVFLESPGFFPSTAFLRSKKAKGWLGMVGYWGQG
jgi:hypothetical protein